MAEAKKATKVKPVKRQFTVTVETWPDTKVSNKAMSEAIRSAIAGHAASDGIDFTAARVQAVPTPKGATSASGAK